jgi:hypothetical protein
MARRKNTPAPALPLAKDGAALAALRAEGLSWGEIQERAGAKSAIPLRKVLRTFLAESQAEGFQMEATPANVVAARDTRGEGWPLIAARTGLKVSEVKDLYAKGEGASLAGRVYVGQGGATIYLGADRASEPVVKPEPVKPARRRKAAPKADATTPRERRAARQAAAAPRRAAK